MKKWAGFLILVLFNNGFSEPAGNAEDFLFTVECTDGSRGSAFLMKDSDGVWMVSNCHVASGKPPVRFINMRDTNYVWQMPKEIEVAEDRDVVRFHVAESNGFAITSQYSFDDEVAAFGNSGGLGIITKSKGEIIGLGANEIEVSCEIIEGNSGGPLVNSENQVIGVSTFIVKPQNSSDSKSKTTSKKESTSGTRYENFRRFGISLSKVIWQKTALEAFTKEATVFQEKVDEYKIAVSSLVFVKSRLPVKETAVEYLVQPSVIRSYNRNIAIKSLFGQSGSYSRSAHLRVFKNLSEGAEKWAGNTRELAGNEFSVKYFSKGMQDLADDLDQAVTAIQSSFDSMK